MKKNADDATATLEDLPGHAGHGHRVVDMSDLTKISETDLTGLAHAGAESLLELCQEILKRNDQPGSGTNSMGLAVVFMNHVLDDVVNADDTEEE